MQRATARSVVAFYLPTTCFPPLFFYPSRQPRASVYCTRDLVAAAATTSLECRLNSLGFEYFMRFSIFSRFPHFLILSFLYRPPHLYTLLHDAVFLFSRGEIESRIESNLSEFVGETGGSPRTDAIINFVSEWRLLPRSWERFISTLYLSFLSQLLIPTRNICTFISLWPGGINDLSWISFIQSTLT